MSDAIKKIAKHYKTAISGGLQKIHVEEWDMDIYYKNTYAFRDEARVVELQQQGKTVDALVEGLIVKALDENGRRIFTDADKINLMNEADPNVIVRVIGTINAAEYRVKTADTGKE